MLQKLIDRKVLPQAFLTTAGMPAAATASAGHRPRKVDNANSQVSTRKHPTSSSTLKKRDSPPALCLADAEHLPRGKYYWYIWHHYPFKRSKV